MGQPARVVWSPQPGPQKALLDCPYKCILFGGARGGGKTDGILGKWAIKGERYGKAFNAVFFRREMPQQDDLIERAKEIYEPIGGRWLEQKKTFLLPSGGRIRFRPLDTVKDAQKYQGQNVTDAAVEEAGNYPDPAPIDMLFGCLRSRGGVPIQLLLTANPGGSGHQWLKARFIDPSPRGMVPIVRKLPNGKEFRMMFIPSRVQDNRILLANDPDYVDRLYLVGSAELVKAWLTGDWNVVTGAYFSQFGDRHVVDPFKVPRHWARFRAFDWGYAKPFCCGWYAVSDGRCVNCSDRGCPQGEKCLRFPRGALVKYREWYGKTGPNKGVRLEDPEIARGIKRLSAGEEYEYSVADPSMFDGEGGPCPAESFRLEGVVFRRADNDRKAGWRQFRTRLGNKDFGHTPMIYFFSTCRDSIRTIPTLQHDDLDAEDLDSDGEDHAADETRYACMSRPFVRDPGKEDEPVRDITKATFRELMKLSPRRGGHKRV